MEKEPPPRVKVWHSCNRVKIFLMLGGGVIFSSDSFAISRPFHDPSPDSNRAAASIFFYLWEFGLGEWALLVVCSLFMLLKAETAQWSLTNIICEGGAPIAPLSYNSE